MLQFIIKCTTIKYIMNRFSSNLNERPRKKLNLFGEEKKQKSYSYTPYPRLNTQDYERSGTQKIIKKPYMQQNSKFLPILHQNHTKQRSSRRMRNYSEPSLDSESQTVQYLSQCEKIIQNLKKLTNTETKKIAHKRMVTPSLIQYSTQTIDNDKNFKTKKRQSMAEQQILRIRIPEQTFSKKSRQKYDKLFDSTPQNNQGKTRRKKNQSQFFQKDKSQGNQKNSLGNKSFKTMQQNDANQFIQNKLILKKNDEGQQEGFSKNYKGKNVNSLQNSPSEDRQLSAKVQAQEKQKMKRLQIIKYLQNAKKGGTNLHEKIKRHKLNIKFHKKGQFTENE